MPDKVTDAPERMLRWFAFGHLPNELQDISVIFHSAAHTLCKMTSAGPERTVALRKLLEAKDAGVRAYLEARP